MKTSVSYFCQLLDTHKKKHISCLLPASPETIIRQALPREVTPHFNIIEYSPQFDTGSYCSVVSK